ncbi:MAG: hypothetical protein O3A96_00965 [Proteobacteria bacterium]|nr:hypothetical protein [Pseudomonadota bacterium]
MNHPAAMPASLVTEGSARISAPTAMPKARFILRRRSVRLGSLEIHFLWVANGRAAHRSSSRIGDLRRTCETLLSILLLAAVILTIGGLAVFGSLELMGFAETLGRRGWE